MLSPQRIERLRSLLLEQQASLQQQMVGLDYASQGGNVGLSNHMAEDATSAFDQAAAVSLRRGYGATLEQVGQALHRMDAGQYGACERCRNEIDFARLKAVPHAMLCLACQRLVER
ncbi:MAG: TraR/DksA family transcriptional regulator [Chloroflexi bacterium]|nr:TraR/DksA family transcriptional regulator [Chloroflexota bacterium]